MYPVQNPTPTTAPVPELIASISNEAHETLLRADKLRSYGHLDAADEMEGLAETMHAMCLDTASTSSTSALADSIEKTAYAIHRSAVKKFGAKEILCAMEMQRCSERMFRLAGWNIGASI